MTTETKILTAEQVAAIYNKPQPTVFDVGDLARSHKAMSVLAEEQDRMIREGNAELEALRGQVETLRAERDALVKWAQASEHQGYVLANPDGKTFSTAQVVRVSDVLARLGQTGA